MTRILVVDQDAELRRALTRDLTRHGFQVHAVASLEAALASALATPVDLLLTDVLASERNGLDLVSELRDHRPACRTIVMSTLDTEDAGLAATFGAARVLSKPFTAAELRAAIRDAQAASSDLASAPPEHVLDVFRLLRRRPGSTRVEWLGGGSVQLRDGEFVHAALGPLAGEDALLELLARSLASSNARPSNEEFQELRSCPSGKAESAEGEHLRTIRRPFLAVLLGLLELLDEREPAARKPRPASEPACPARRLPFRPLFSRTGAARGARGHRRTRALRRKLRTDNAEMTHTDTHTCITDRGVEKK